jgi:hypothetical protein
MFIGATSALALGNLIKSGVERGYEIRGQADPLYAQMEPTFMREARQRELLGTADEADIRSLRGVRTAAGAESRSEENRRAYDAAVSKLRKAQAADSSDTIVAGAAGASAVIGGTIGFFLGGPIGAGVGATLAGVVGGAEGNDIEKVRLAAAKKEALKVGATLPDKQAGDVTASLASERFRTLKAELGELMGLPEAAKTYDSFRAGAGVANMQFGPAARALRTATLAGLSPELLAAAAATGAMPGQTGGGIRIGKDGLTDIGTLRFQQESLLRANVQGAPANRIMQETLQRQAALAAAGALTNFDRDALMQHTLLSSGVAPQQLTPLTNQLSDMRANAIERNVAPRRQVLASLLEASAYVRGGTNDEALRILTDESEAEQIEGAINAGVLSSDELINYTSGMAGSKRKQFAEALRSIGRGSTRGKAEAEGIATLTPYEFARTAINQRLTYSAIGGQSDLTKQEVIVDFQTSLDEAAKSLADTADSLKAVTAALGSVAMPTAVEDD